jgi:hypothetical protein
VLQARVNEGLCRGHTPVYMSSFTPRPQHPHLLNDRLPLLLVVLRGTAQAGGVGECLLHTQLTIQQVILHHIPRHLAGEGLWGAAGGGGGGGGGGGPARGRAGAEVRRVARRLHAGVFKPPVQPPSVLSHHQPPRLLAPFPACTLFPPA